MTRTEVKEMLIGLENGVVVRLSEYKAKAVINEKCGFEYGRINILGKAYEEFIVFSISPLIETFVFSEDKLYIVENN